MVEANEDLGIAAFVAYPGKIGVSIEALRIADNVTQKGIGLLGRGNDSVVDGRSLGTKVPCGADQVHAAVGHFLGSKPAAVVGLEALAGVCRWS